MKKQDLPVPPRNTHGSVVLSTDQILSNTIIDASLRFAIQTDCHKTGMMLNSSDNKLQIAIKDQYNSILHPFEPLTA